MRVRQAKRCKGRSTSLLLLLLIACVACEQPTEKARKESPAGATTEPTFGRPVPPRAGDAAPVAADVAPAAAPAAGDAPPASAPAAADAAPSVAPTASAAGKTAPSDRDAARKPATNSAGENTASTYQGVPRTEAVMNLTAEGDAKNTVTGYILTAAGPVDFGDLPENGNAKISGIKSKVLACYERVVAGEASRRPASQLVVWTTIEADGRISNAGVRVDSSPPGASACVVPLVRALKFSAPKKGKMEGLVMFQFNMKFRDK